MAGTMLPLAKGVNILMRTVAVMMVMLLFTIKNIDDKTDYNAAEKLD